MTLDLSSVGYRTEQLSFNYDWQKTALYALGIGAQKDELTYLYEGEGPKVYPTFAVVPAYQVLDELAKKTGGNLETMVHGAQVVRLHRPIPAGGTLQTVGSIDAIYDMKRMAQVVLKSESRIDGELICETEWTLIFRGEGGFGGSAPPKGAIPTIARAAEPIWTKELVTTPEQALLYRLSGDLNPLHADPAFAARVGFERGPILHGLATYGFTARAIVACACGGDGDRLAAFGADFRRPVWPGDRLLVRGYALEDGRIGVKVSTTDDPESAVSTGFAEIRP